MNGETIVSKLNPAWFIMMGLIYGTVITLMAFITYVAFRNNTNQLWAIGAILILIGLQILKIYWGINKRITVSPNHIVVEYFFIKPDKIDYKEITSIRNLSGEAVRRGTRGFRQQDIKLIDGEILFSEMQFENYGELKNAIYQYMLAANRNAAPIAI